MNGIETYLERLSSVGRIMLTLVDRDGSIEWIRPEPYEGAICREQSLRILEHLLGCGADIGHPVIVYFSKGFLLGVVQLPDGRYAVFGPAASCRHTENEVRSILGGYLQPEYHGGVCSHLSEQPLMSTAQLRHLLCLAAHASGVTVREEDILYSNGNTPVRIIDLHALELLPAPCETSRAYVSMDFEAQLCSAVETGNRALLSQKLFVPPQGRAGCMSEDELRQKRYVFIALATLASRAAIRGGLPETVSLSLSDMYCRRMDASSDEGLLRSLTATMLTDYCDRVAELRRQPTSSPAIRSCLAYISLHLHEPITIGLLSKQLGLCTRSLSMRFRSEIGMGIPEYIHREKLREADHLLRYTDRSLSEITAYLNYPTQSYFTQVYRKYRGVTPQQFRNAEQVIGAAHGHRDEGT